MTEMPPPPPKVVDIDHLLENVVGATGRWQIKFFALALAIYDAAFLVLVVHLFAAFTPQHRYY